MLLLLLPGDVRRREEDVPQGRAGRAPRQAGRVRQRPALQAHLHGAQRRVGKVPGGGAAVEE